MKHIVILLAALAVAGCGGTPNADNARRICTANGHSLGTPAFDRCFETTYASIMGSSGGARSAPGPVVCNRVGSATICN